MPGEQQAIEGGKDNQVMKTNQEKDKKGKGATEMEAG